MDKNLPVAVNSGSLLNKFIVQISSENEFSLALSNDNNIHAWGLNNYGQLGINSTINSNIPIQAIKNNDLQNKTISNIIASNSFSLLFTNDSEIFVGEIYKYLKY